MNQSGQAVWLRHPDSGKYHAFRQNESESACGLTSKAIGEPVTDVPSWPDACWLCCKELGVRPSGSRKAAPEPEQMVVEFIGGPMDGIRLMDLSVVRRSNGSFTVLEAHYQRRFKPAPQEKVEQKEPWQ